MLSDSSQVLIYPPYSRKVSVICINQLITYGNSYT